MVKDYVVILLVSVAVLIVVFIYSCFAISSYEARAEERGKEWEKRRDSR